MTVANLSRFMCPGGKPGHIAGGKPILDPKSGSFTKDGAAAMWNFLFDAAAKARA